MDWKNEVAGKLKRKNQVLFSKDSAFLQDLIILFQGQDHKVMILWALDFAAETVSRLEAAYPNELRPREALEAAQDWASGKIKMRLAQRKILDCHAFARELENKEHIAMCHAVGQACAVVHTAGHAIGYPIYDLTSLIYGLGVDNCDEAIQSRKQTYIDNIFYWNEHIADRERQWAGFLCR